MRNLLVTQQFQKDFRKIPKAIKNQTQTAVAKLQRNPTHRELDIRKLHATKLRVWRVRIQSYRLIYSFTKTSLTLHRIRHRKDIYKLNLIAKS